MKSYSELGFSSLADLHFHIGSMRITSPIDFRAAYAILAVCSLKEVEFSTRSNYLLKEAQYNVLGLLKVIDIITFYKNNISNKIYIHGDINSLIPDSSSFLNEIREQITLKMNLLMREGKDIQLIQTNVIHHKTYQLLVNACKEHTLVDDFQDSILFHTLGNRTFDENLLSETKNIVEYTTKMSLGVEGIEKRELVEEDLNLATTIMFAISNKMIERYPFNTEHRKIDYSLRAFIYLVKHSDIVCLIVKSSSSVEDLIFPDNWALEIVKSFNKPYILLDSVTNQWYSQSVSSKRSLVKSRVPNWKRYLNPGIYVNPEIVLKSWTEFKKSMK